MDYRGVAGEPALGDIIARVNKDEHGPSQRAARVYSFLRTHPGFTNWDVICFAAEYLGAQSITPSLDWLQAPTRDLIRAIYTAHYIRFENVEWTDQQPISSDKVSEKMESDTTGGG